MTRPPFERVLRTFVSDVPETAPRDLLESVLIELPTVKQRRRPFGLGRWDPAQSSRLRAIALAAAVFVITVVGYSIFARGDFTGPGGPTATPTEQPSLSPSPTAGPTPRISGATVPADETALAAGVTYVLKEFEPPFTFVGDPAIKFGIDGPRYAWLEIRGKPLSPLGIVQPVSVFQESTVNEALPPDIVAWLKARTDLTVLSETPITLGSANGTLLDGTVPEDAFHNEGGAINLFCPETAGCAYQAGGSLGYAPGDHVLIIVATVGDLPIVAMATMPEAEWATDGPTVDAFLRSFDFPAGS